MKTQNIYSRTSSCKEMIVYVHEKYYLHDWWKKMEFVALNYLLVATKSVNVVRKMYDLNEI